jgi:hypothetical protein
MISIKKCWDTKTLRLLILPAAFLMTIFTVRAQEAESMSRVFKKHNAPVRALAFHPEGNPGYRGDDRMIYFWIFNR